MYSELYGKSKNWSLIEIYLNKSLTKRTHKSKTREMEITILMNALVRKMLNHLLAKTKKLLRIYQLSKKVQVLPSEILKSHLCKGKQSNRKQSQRHHNLEDIVHCQALDRNNVMRLLLVGRLQKVEESHIMQKRV